MATSVEILTKEDIKEAVREILQEVLPGLLRSADVVDSVNPIFLDKKQAAEFLHVSEGTIDNLRRRGVLINTPINGTNKVLFKYTDILDFLSSNGS